MHHFADVVKMIDIGKGCAAPKLMSEEKDVEG